ncbi:hypothetical protein HDV00_003737, partial [Rhizophlyctis rosea]
SAFRTTSSETVIGTCERRVFRYELSVFPPDKSQGLTALRLKEEHTTISSTAPTITFSFPQHVISQYLHANNSVPAAPLSLRIAAEISTVQKLPRLAIQPSSLPSPLSDIFRAILFDDSTADILLEFGPETASADASQSCVQYAEIDGSLRSFLPAHKTVLLANSPYFAALFRSGVGLSLTADTGLGPRMAVATSTYSHQGLSAMLQIMYCGVIDTRAPTILDDLLELIDMANYYQLPGLHAAATELIVSSKLAPETAIYILGIALVNSNVSDLLVTYAQAYVQKNFSVVMKSVVVRYMAQVTGYVGRLRAWVYEDVEEFVGCLCQVMEEVDGGGGEGMEVEDDDGGEGEGGQSGVGGSSSLPSFALRDVDSIPNTDPAMYAPGAPPRTIADLFRAHFQQSSVDELKSVPRDMMRSVRGLARLCGRGGRGGVIGGGG